MPAARGQHLFTRTKRFLMDWAREAGAGGDVQRGDRGPPLQPAGQHRAGRARDRLPARLDPGLGRQRRGRRGAARRRQSAALFYTKLNDGHERRGLRARAPPRDRRPDAGAVRAARHPGPAAARTPSWRSGPSCTSRSTPTTTWRCSRSRCPAPTWRRRSRPSATTSSTAPASTPSTSTCRWRPRRRRLVADHLERLGVSYAGVFPNHRTDGDVLRMQSLHRVRVKADDVAVASDHGRELLDYVLCLTSSRREVRARAATSREARWATRPCA